MGWRFRQSFKIIPGVRLNLSRSGLSASIGGAPFTLNFSSRGVMSTASLPGTGVSYRQLIGKASQQDYSANSQECPPIDSTTRVSSGTLPSLLSPELPTGQEIRSASPELLTSQCFRHLKELSETAYLEKKDIETGLGKAEQSLSIATSRFNSWESGFLLKKLFKKKFEARSTELAIETAKVAELKDQLRQTSIPIHVEMEQEQAELYSAMRQAFSALCGCASIWSFESVRTADRISQRTDAEASVTRSPVKFSLGSFDLLDWEQEVPHLRTGRGEDLFLYPGFVIYSINARILAIIGYHDIVLSPSNSNFIESEAIPSDSKIIKKTWFKANKDGTRDKRFVANYEIPVVRYGELALKGDSGLWMKFQFSNPERSESFGESWINFVSSFHSHQQESAKIDQRSAFDSESERARKLSMDRPKHWEYLLIAELVQSKLLALRKEFVFVKPASEQSIPLDPEEYLGWLKMKLRQPSLIMEGMKSILERKMSEAFGKPGVPGDPLAILRCANEMESLCRDLIEWEEDIKRVNVSDPVLKSLSATVEGMAGALIDQALDFPRQVFAVFANGAAPTGVVEIRVKFSAPPQLDKFSAELSHLKTNRG
jgi:hypothetical protein